MTEALEIKPSITKQYNNYCYKGFIVKWTGWKEFPDSTKIVGQWLAENKNGNKIYSSVPGCCSDYIDGDIFNVSTMPHQNYLHLESASELRELEKDKGLELLKQVIDALVERQANVPKFPMEKIRS